DLIDLILVLLRLLDSPLLSGDQVLHALGRCRRRCDHSREHGGEQCCALRCPSHADSSEISKSTVQIFPRTARMRLSATDRRPLADLHSPKVCQVNEPAIADPSLRIA